MSTNIEYQYRAWDKTRERMMSVQTIDFFWGIVCFQVFEKQADGSFIHRPSTYEGVGSESIEDVVLLILTGLPEKNDEDLFDRDIVRWVDTEGNEFVREITIGDCLTVSVGEMSYYRLINSGYLQTKLEKIGNSFENPELLMRSDAKKDLREAG